MNPRLTARVPVAALLLSLVVVAGCESEGKAKRRREPPEIGREDRQNPEADYPINRPVKPVADRGNGQARTGHPRLFLPAGNAFAAVDGQARAWQDKLRQRADETLGKPPIEYAKGKILAKAREAAKRLTQVAAVYQFTRDPRYAEFVRRELVNLCSYPDWQPDDFLATAEMMFAVATAYDWTYDALPDADRRTIAAGLLNLGLKQSQQAYATKSGWTYARHNWNMVCNGGTIVAALALMDEAPATSKRAISDALRSLRNGLDAYDPQGGTHEGPMYHNYGTRYLTYAAAAMESVYGTSGAIEQISTNWLNAGDYRMETSGPVAVAGGGYKSANFGDCSEVIGNSAWMYWLAKRTGRPEYAAFETVQDRDEPSAFDLLWYTPGTGAKTPPLAARFGSVLTMRTGFDDPDATFVALRCGTANENHTHLDLGTFVYDTLGRRFVADLGPDNYDLPGYLYKRKADYLRSSTPGHNTITIGDASQPGEAFAAGTLAAGRGAASAAFNLREAYPTARSATRTATLDGRALVIRDEFRFANDVPLTWNLHTQADVRQDRVNGDGRRVTLEIDGRRVEVRVEEPAGARLTMEPDEVRPPSYPLKGFTHLRWTAPAGSQTRFVVRFTPLQ